MSSISSNFLLKFIISSHKSPIKLNATPSNPNTSSNQPFRQSQHPTLDSSISTILSCTPKKKCNFIVLTFLPIHSIFTDKKFSFPSFPMLMMIFIPPDAVNSVTIHDWLCMRNPAVVYVRIPQTFLKVEFLLLVCSVFFLYFFLP